MATATAQAAAAADAVSVATTADAVESWLNCGSRSCWVMLVSALTQFACCPLWCATGSVNTDPSPRATPQQLLASETPFRTLAPAAAAGGYCSCWLLCMGVCVRIAVTARCSAVAPLGLRCCCCYCELSRHRTTQCLVFGFKSKVGRQTQEVGGWKGGARVAGQSTSATCLHEAGMAATAAATGKHINTDDTGRCYNDSC
jgi:hypothetical protein